MLCGACIVLLIAVSDSLRMRSSVCMYRQQWQQECRTAATPLCHTGGDVTSIVIEALHRKATTPVCPHAAQSVFMTLRVYVVRLRLCIGVWKKLENL